MKLSTQYAAAMIAGNCGLCLEIERRHGLDGFTPEQVSIGLKALEDGLDPYRVIAEQMGQRDDKTIDLFEGLSNDERFGGCT